MTDVTPEATTTPTEVLVRHAIYQQFGITRIAIDDTTLQDLVDTNTVTATPQQVTLLEMPGTPAWTDRMARVRATAVRTLAGAQKQLHDKNDHLERLGQAILEQANEREWCEEYDAFAEEWGLPKRTSEWEVTMTVRVTARNEDDALAIVRDNISLDSYSTEGVNNSPEFYASEM